MAFCKIKVTDFCPGVAGGFISALAPLSPHPSIVLLRVSTSHSPDVTNS